MKNLFEIIMELEKSGEKAALAVIIASDGSTPRKVGTKMVVLPNGEIAGTIGGGMLEAQVIEDAKRSITENAPGRFSYPLDAAAGQCCGGKVEVFIDVIGNSVPLYIFGAGHVGCALAHILEGTPFAPHLIDERENVPSQVIPENAVLHRAGWKDFVDKNKVEGKYAAVMTHDHEHDLEIIDYLCQRKWKYLGLMGSTTKWGQFKVQLKKAGRSEEEIASVRCPIGNKKLGSSPQEIAISISSELLEIHHAL
jgi:xanthine dehydrogenase accessory factor